MNATLLIATLLVEVGIALGYAAACFEEFIRTGREMVLHFSNAYLPEDGAVAEDAVRD